MTKSIAIKSAFSCGGKAWDYLEHISCKNVVLIRDSQMSQGVSNIVSKIRTYMDSMGVIMGEYDIGGDKLSQIQLIGGIQFMSEKKPDMVIAIGSELTIKIAKLMLIFYEYPELADSTIGECRYQRKKPSYQACSHFRGFGRSRGCKSSEFH